MRRASEKGFLRWVSPEANPRQWVLCKKCIKEVLPRKKAEHCAISGEAIECCKGILEKKILFQAKEPDCYAPTPVSHQQGLPWADRNSQALPPLGWHLKSSQQPKESSLENSRQVSASKGRFKGVRGAQRLWKGTRRMRVGFRQHGLPLVKLP